MTWRDWEEQLVDGQFPLRRYLGGSQHSAVYLTARPDQTPQDAVIKLVTAKPSNDQINEWKIAAELSHPHLIRIYAFGQWKFEDTPFLYVVMEQAEEDLSQILPSRPLTAEEARQMIEPTVDALGYLHGKGLVHGHLKPSNVMASGDRLMISTDRILRAGESGSRTGYSGAYAAPEMADGKISPAIDVWMLGVTLVEALTQRLPTARELDSPETAFAELPAPFDTIARHCLQRNPENRWTVADIAARLRGQAVEPERQTQKRRYLVPVLGAALGLAAIGVVGSKLMDRGGGEPPQASSVPDERPEVPPKSVPPPAPNIRREAKQREAKKQASAAAPTAAPKPSAPRTNLPDGADIVHRVVPEVPASARKTIRGSVRVQVRVLAGLSGNVAQATLVSAGPSRYFAGLALNAARQWKFKAPSVDSRPVSSLWNLRFTFTRSGAKVDAARTAP